MELSTGSPASVSYFGFAVGTAVLRNTIYESGRGGTPVGHISGHWFLLLSSARGSALPAAAELRLTDLPEQFGVRKLGADKKEPEAKFLAREMPGFVVCLATEPACHGRASRGVRRYRSSQRVRKISALLLLSRIQVAAAIEVIVDLRCGRRT
jgi:hypothetical protein